MSRVGRLETIVEVKAPAAKIHEVFSCRPHIVTITSPESVESCELLEGETGKPGCVICRRFCRGGYWRSKKSFYSIAKVNPKDEGSLVHWAYKYEKQNEDVPDLESKLLQLAINNIKDIDAYLLNQQQLQLQA